MKIRLHWFAYDQGKNGQIPGLPSPELNIGTAVRNEHNCPPQPSHHGSHYPRAAHQS